MPADDLSTETLSALAEPNRKRIVELLRDGPLTVGEIAERLGMRQPQASKHLKVLTEAGLLEMKPDANRRIYGIRAAPFEALNAWAKSFQALTEQRYDNLAAYLKKVQKENER